MKTKLTYSAFGVTVTLLLLASCLSPSASAQDGFIDRLQSGVDGVARGMNYVGKRASELLGTGITAERQPGQIHVSERRFSEQHPVGSKSTITLSNMFGAVTVDSWNERVVKIEAHVIIRASDAAVATEVANGVRIDIVASPELVEAHTVLPDIRPVTAEINYKVTIPRNADIIVDNFFGDTYIRNVRGKVVVEAPYGLVELKEIRGPVHVRAQGEFPVSIDGLYSGGTLELNGSITQLQDIHGTVKIGQFRGSIVLSELGEACEIDLTSDNCPVRVMLPGGQLPDITATLMLGRLQTTLPMAKYSGGNRLVARHPNHESNQRLIVHGSFSDISLEQESLNAEALDTSLSGLKPFNDVIQKSFSIPENGRLSVNGVVGNIHVEGNDQAQIEVRATRHIWAARATEAPEQLESLQVDFSQKNPDTLEISTAIGSERAQWPNRIDLYVRCPRTLLVDIASGQGETRVEGLGESISIKQESGTVLATHNKGPVTVVNRHGDVSLSEIGGAVDVEVYGGIARLTRMYSAARVLCTEGRTIIDSPQSDVFVRNKGGDVRILALNGISGNHDVYVENGNLAMALSKDANVTVSATARQGTVDSVLPLTGNLQRDLQEFHGRFGEGRHHIKLETQGGNIILD